MEKKDIEERLTRLGYSPRDNFFITKVDKGNTDKHKIEFRLSYLENYDIIELIKETIELINNILKLLGIKFLDDHSFLANQDNFKKLPSKQELSEIVKHFKKETKIDSNDIRASNALKLQLNIIKVNPIINLPSTSILSPQGNIINSSLFFKNIWHNTKRANGLRFATDNEDKFIKYLQRNTSSHLEEINEKSHDFFIGFFSKAFQEMEKKMSEKTQSFSWQDAINTLAIAKAFGGLSNIKKDGQNEGYKKISDSEFIAAIKLKFPEVIDFQSLDSAKLGQYKIFSKLYQKTTQDILKSNRGANNQTGLRLTFFPDHAIERLLGIKDTKANFKENIAQSAQIIDDFIKPKPKLMIAYV
jgi:hypothetical protein